MWRKRYVDWPAMKKLDYMDELMGEVAGKTPVITTTHTVEPLRRIRRTLRQHYKRKRKHYGLEHPHFYDRDLRRLFSDGPEHTRNMPADRFVKRVRRDVRRLVASWTGTYQYTIDQVLEDIITRCGELSLHLRSSEERTKQDFTVLLTVQTMSYLHSGRHRVAL